jgi:RNA polymerase sigma factor (sigma-70 family)
MDSCDFPRTVEEMLEAGWYEKILKMVKRSNLKDVLNSPEELVQDVFCNIIKTDYLSRYDPEYRPFYVYIYVLVNNLIKKRGIRENTAGGRKVVNALALEDTVEGDTVTPNTIYLDLLEIEDNLESPDDRLYIDTIIDRARTSLQNIKSHSAVEFDGTLVSRDPATVFEYILEGRSVSEIAEILGVSKQYVYVLIHKIRGVEAMQELYNNALERHIIVPKVV